MNTLTWILDDSFSTRLTVALLHFLWQGCCVGLVVWICGTLLGAATARLRYSLNVASLLVMAACLPLTFLLVGNPASVPTGPVASEPVNAAPSPQSMITASPAHSVHKGN